MMSLFVHPQYITRIKEIQAGFNSFIKKSPPQIALPFEKVNARGGIKHGAFSLTKGVCAFTITGTLPWPSGTFVLEGFLIISKKGVRNEFYEVVSVIENNKRVHRRAQT